MKTPLETMREYLQLAEGLGDRKLNPDDYRFPFDYGTIEAFRASVAALELQERNARQQAEAEKELKEAMDNLRLNLSGIDSWERRIARLEELLGIAPGR